MSDRFITRIRRLISDDEATTGVVIERTVTAIVEPPSSRPTVKPLSQGCPIWLEDKYRGFVPQYRCNLQTFSTTLIAIEWSSEVQQYIAAYCGGPRYCENNRFIWGYLNNSMVELEQVNQNGRTNFDIDRRWLAMVTG